MNVLEHLNVFLSYALIKTASSSMAREILEIPEKQQAQVVGSQKAEDCILLLASVRLLINHVTVFDHKQETATLTADLTAKFSAKFSVNSFPSLRQAFICTMNDRLWHSAAATVSSSGLWPLPVACGCGWLNEQSFWVVAQPESLM